MNTRIYVYTYGTAVIALALFSSLNAIINRIDYRVQTDGPQAVITVQAPLGEQEAIMHDGITLESLNPAYTIVSYTCPNQPILYMPHEAPEPVKAYDATFACIITVARTDQQPVSINSDPIALRLAYQHNQTGAQETRFTITDPAGGSIILQEQPQDQATAGILYWITHVVDMVVAKISDMLTKSQLSLGAMLAIVFLLGLLTSLTPCIYPMIPITVGILQGGASSRVWSNFLRAGAYASGISTTYAIIGMVAAMGKTQFGSLTSHPLVIGLLVMFFAYLAGSMLGWYEMYTPGFMQPRHRQSSGSYLGAFFFGLLNGTIASPCLSPSLALVLGITAHWPLIKAFSLIFVYGIGTCVPLLIIATYTQSLEKLPRAGMWMVEIKKFFGLMLFGMCIYIARPLLHVSLYYCLWALLLFVIALYYLSSVKGTRHRTLRALCVGTIALSGWLMLSGLQAWFLQPPHAASVVWNRSLETGRTTAQREHKFLLVNASAPSWCSACVALEKKLLHVPAFEHAVQEHVVLVMLDSDIPAQSEDIKRCRVMGFPKLLLIDPETDEIIRSWGAEFIKYNPEQAVQVIADTIKNRA